MMQALAMPRARAARFLTVGTVTAGLFFVLTYGLAALGMPAFWASLLAYALSFVAGYTGQRRWTFGARHRHGHALPRYLAAQLACALGAAAIAHVAVAAFSVAPLAMSAITTLAASAASYLLSSLWVFPERAAG